MERKYLLRGGVVGDSPLPDDSADLVICHILLCNVPDIKAAAKGMTKVTRSGGTVCSIEPVFLGGFSPNPRANLIVEGHSANIEGAWIKRKELIRYPEQYPYNRYVYPRVFAECGLSRIEVHALARSYYNGDWRRTKEDLIQDARDWLGLLNKHKERYEANLKRTGWKKNRSFLQSMA